MTAAPTLSLRIRKSPYFEAKVRHGATDFIVYNRMYLPIGYADSVLFQHPASGEAVICENADTLVLSLGHESVTELDRALADFPGEVRRIGDRAAPRTVEEAVLEGLKAGVAV